MLLRRHRSSDLFFVSAGDSAATQNIVTPNSVTLKTPELCGKEFQLEVSSKSPLSTYLQCNAFSMPITDADAQ
jgi:hypothetical protein